MVRPELFAQLQQGFAEFADLGISSVRGSQDNPGDALGAQPSGIGCAAFLGLSGVLFPLSSLFGVRVLFSAARPVLWGTGPVFEVSIVGRFSPGCQRRTLLVAGVSVLFAPFLPGSLHCRDIAAVSRFHGVGTGDVLQRVEPVSAFYAVPGIAATVAVMIALVGVAAFSDNLDWFPRLCLCISVVPIYLLVLPEC